MEHKWRKLVKSETLWTLQAPPEGLHLSQDGEEHWVLPLDYVVDFVDKRVIYRPRDFVDMLQREHWTPFDPYEGRLSPFYDDLIIRCYKRSDVIEVANHITDGKEHADLWVERKQREDAQTMSREPAELIIVHRQKYIDELLAEGYQWEAQTAK